MAELALSMSPTVYHRGPGLQVRLKASEAGFVFCFPRPCGSETCEKQPACQANVLSRLHEREASPLQTRFTAAEENGFLGRFRVLKFAQLAT